MPCPPKSDMDELMSAPFGEPVSILKTSPKRKRKRKARGKAPVPEREPDERVVGVALVSMHDLRTSPNPVDGWCVRAVQASRRSARPDSRHGSCDGTGTRAVPPFLPQV